MAEGVVTPLEEQTARHIVQVLRRQPGDRVLLCDGCGRAAEAVITEAGKKKCTVQIHSVALHKEPALLLHMGVAFTKNASRNEWLLEKATELGVRSIIPLSTARTEKEHLRYDRWKNILVSAMLQSQQYYLPELTQPLPLATLAATYAGVEQKLLAHCIAGKKKAPLPVALQPGKSTLLLIGPEGDFTEEEVLLCEGHGFAGVSLGGQRLRTETAAMAACAYFNMINHAE